MSHLLLLAEADVVGHMSANVIIPGCQASPLILGADLRKVGVDHPDCLELILNPEVLAVNQDPAARPPVLVSQVPAMLEPVFDSLFWPTILPAAVYS